MPPCCDESGLKKGPWTDEEDDTLVKHIQKHGHSSWRALPRLAGLNRCGKSCRLRWTNYLRPDIKRGNFSDEEEQTNLHFHSIRGNKWSAIVTRLPGRTDNEIKNYWNTHLKKKLIQMGIDPMTHRPCTDDIYSSLPHLIALANLVDHHSSLSLDQQLSLILKLQTQQTVHDISKFQYLATRKNTVSNYLLQPAAAIPLQSSLQTIYSVAANIESHEYVNLYGSLSLSGLSNADNHMNLDLSHMPELQLMENTSSDVYMAGKLYFSLCSYY